MPGRGRGVRTVVLHGGRRAPAQLVLVHREARALVHLLAERIVLVGDGNALDADSGQVLHQLLGRSLLLAKRWL